MNPQIRVVPVADHHRLSHDLWNASPACSFPASGRHVGGKSDSAGTGIVAIDDACQGKTYSRRFHCISCPVIPCGAKTASPIKTVATCTPHALFTSPRIAGRASMTGVAAVAGAADRGLRWFLAHLARWLAPYRRLTLLAVGAANLVEVNPIPGLNPVSSDLVIMNGLLGRSYQALVGLILDAALKRLSVAGRCASTPRQALT